MRRLLWGFTAIVGCVVAGAEPVTAQGATSCDSPCKVMHLPLIGPRGAVCDSPCKLINLPLVQQQGYTSQAKLPFIVDTVVIDSAGRVVRGSRPLYEALRTYSESQVDRQAKLLPGSPSPIYPESLKIKKVEGDFVAQFIVDTTGRVEVASFRVLKRGHPLFIAAVRDVLPQLRYSPAELKGVKVRQMIQQPFVFSLSP